MKKLLLLLAFTLYATAPTIHASKEYQKEQKEKKEAMKKKFTSLSKKEKRELERKQNSPTNQDPQKPNKNPSASCFPPLDDKDETNSFGSAFFNNAQAQFDEEHKNKDVQIDIQKKGDSIIRDGINEHLDPEELSINKNGPESDTEKEDVMKEDKDSIPEYNTMVIENNHGEAHLKNTSSNAQTQFDEEHKNKDVQIDIQKKGDSIFKDGINELLDPEELSINKNDPESNTEKEDILEFDTIRPAPNTELSETEALLSNGENPLYDNPPLEIGELKEHEDPVVNTEEYEEKITTKKQELLEQANLYLDSSSTFENLSDEDQNEIRKLISNAFEDDKVHDVYPTTMNIMFNYIDKKKNKEMFFKSEHVTIDTEDSPSKNAFNTKVDQDDTSYQKKKNELFQSAYNEAIETKYFKTLLEESEKEDLVAIIKEEIDKIDFSNEEKIPEATLIAYNASITLNNKKNPIHKEAAAWHSYCTRYTITVFSATAAIAGVTYYYREPIKKRIIILKNAISRWISRS